MPNPDAATQQTLIAMLNRLIPGADATALGVFVARRTADSSTVRAGLADLVARGFADRSPAEQDAVLARLDGGDFFEAVRTAAVHGAFGDPMHGGNHDRFGWQLLGYPGPKQTWTAAEQVVSPLGDPCPQP